MVPYLELVPIFCSGAENAYKFVLYLLQNSIIIQEIYARTVPSNGAIWDDFIKQHQHQSFKKAPYLIPN